MGEKERRFNDGFPLGFWYHPDADADADALARCWSPSRSCVRRLSRRATHPRRALRGLQRRQPPDASRAVRRKHHSSGTHEGSGIVEDPVGVGCAIGVNQTPSVCVVPRVAGRWPGSWATSRPVPENCLQSGSPQRCFLDKTQTHRASLAWLSVKTP